MKKYFVLVFIIILYLSYGLYIGRYFVNVLPTIIDKPGIQQYYDYKGVINVHTNLSTGSGSIPEVIRAAQDSDLDFIFLTDLNIKENPTEFEGYHEQTFVFIDGEYSYLDSRFLNLDSLRDDRFDGTGQSQIIFSDLLTDEIKPKETGLFVLAHPTKPNYKLKPPLPMGIDGFEIINLKRLWQQAWTKNKFNFFWSLIIYPFNTKLSFMRFVETPTENLQIWDQYNKRRPTIGLLGADAEALVKIPYIGQFEFPSYQTFFQIASNHLLLNAELTGDFNSDREKISNAIRSGQFYTAFDFIANPSGFFANIEDKNGNIFPIGSKIKYSEPLKLVIQLPEKPLVPFDVIVYKDGEKMLISNSVRTEFVIHSSGNYRIFVRVIPTFPIPDGKRWTPWILTNPFFIFQ